LICDGSHGDAMRSGPRRNWILRSWTLLNVGLDDCCLCLISVLICLTSVIIYFFSALICFA
jgi:hypothetical protein